MAHGFTVILIVKRFKSSGLITPLSDGVAYTLRNAGSPVLADGRLRNMKHFTYLTQCDRFRRWPNGEQRWQEMMDKKHPVKDAIFDAYCDTSGMLDDGETFFQWLGYTEAKCYRSQIENEDVYFVQADGFEFIYVSTESKIFADMLK